MLGPVPLAQLRREPVLHDDPGKVIRLVLQASGEMTAAPDLNRLTELIEPFNKKGIAITEATTFAGDLEFDSLTVMDFVAEIEDEFDIIISMNQQAEIESYGQLVDAVSQMAD